LKSKENHSDVIRIPKQNGGESSDGGKPENYLSLCSPFIINQQTIIIPTLEKPLMKKKHTFLLSGLYVGSVEVFLQS